MKRLFLLPIVVCAACGMVLLSTCKEEKEEPLLFETTAPTAYTFPETETSATFTVAGNTAWAVDVTEGHDRCSVSPASGKGNATVTVRVTANPDYLQAHTMALRLTAGNYTQDISVTQAAPPCPNFNPGAIAAAGQTVTVGGTPVTINSVQNATGSGAIGYQWYKNDIAIIGATEAYYTPLPTDATVVSANTYTRRAKDNMCNTTLTPSTGSWVLTVVCLDFNPGTIASTGQTVAVGGTPVTINSTQNAAGGDDQISYQWYKDGNAINGATAAYYTPPPADVTVMGAHIYTRHAKDNTCNTTFTLSEGTWVLTAICPNFNPGAIATAGQTINVNGTPSTINNLQYATGNGTISYQWYKNEQTINGATAASYTPPTADATAVGAITYTRKAKETGCNTILTDSEGSWVLRVTCPSFNAGAIATTGQTVAVGGTPSVINSAQNASGGDIITYQWYKNGQAISGATATTYTPPKADATVVGATTYTRHAKNNACNTTFTQATGSWILTVVCPSFNSGAIATGGQTICSGNAVNTITSHTNASGGDNNITYQWRRNGSTIYDATAATYSPVAFNAAVGSHTFTRWAKDGTCSTDWTQSAGQWLLTVNGTPTITLISGNANQTKEQGKAITAIQYTTTNATSAYLSSGALPTGVTGSWSSNTYTISGTISASATVQTYNYTVTFTNGCTISTASGAITVVAPPPPNAYSTTIWTFGLQTWSDRIVADPSNCTKTNVLSSTNHSSTEYKIYDGRYYYSWTCAYNNRDAFCPSPWRLPSLSDFHILVSNTDESTLGNAWGYGGYMWSNSQTGVGSAARFWSSTSNDTITAYNLNYKDGVLQVNYFGTKSYGYQVRCVK
jgi:hypothetical protein